MVRWTAPRDVVIGQLIKYGNFPTNSQIVGNCFAIPNFTKNWHQNVFKVPRVKALIMQHLKSSIVFQIRFTQNQEQHTTKR